MRIMAENGPVLNIQIVIAGSLHNMYASSSSEFNYSPNSFAGLIKRPPRRGMSYEETNNKKKIGKATRRESLLAFLSPFKCNKSPYAIHSRALCNSDYYSETICGIGECCDGADGAYLIKFV